MVGNGLRDHVREDHLVAIEAFEEQQDKLRELPGAERLDLFQHHRGSVEASSNDPLEHGFERDLREELEGCYVECVLLLLALREIEGCDVEEFDCQFLSRPEPTSARDVVCEVPRHSLSCSELPTEIANLLGSCK